MIIVWKGRFLMKGLKRFAVLLLALLALCWSTTLAEGVVSTSVVMRVSRLTQDAVVDEGEDLSMEINMDGVAPASYQWYFNDTPISGAVQKVYNIVNAGEADAGVYRLDAFGEDGNMLVSMDLAVRVITKAVPKSGDNSLPVIYAAAAMGLALALLVIRIRRAA